MHKAVWVPNSLIQDPSINVREKAAYMILLTYNQTERRFLSLDELAAGLGRSRQTVSRLVAGLEAKGLVRRVGRTYRTVFPPGQ